MQQALMQVLKLPLPRKSRPDAPQLATLMRMRKRDLPSTVVAAVRESPRQVSALQMASAPSATSRARHKDTDALSSAKARTTRQCAPVGARRACASTRTPRQLKARASIAATPLGAAAMAAPHMRMRVQAFLRMRPQRGKSVVRATGARAVARARVAVRLRAHLAPGRVTPVLATLAQTEERAATAAATMAITATIKVALNSSGAHPIPIRGV